eukprot:482655-Prymnesium_polylepis.1
MRSGALKAPLFSMCEVVHARRRSLPHTERKASCRNSWKNVVPDFHSPLCPAQTRCRSLPFPTARYCRGPVTNASSENDERSLGHAVLLVSHDHRLLCDGHISRHCEKSPAGPLASQHLRVLSVPWL